MEKTPGGREGAAPLCSSAAAMDGAHLLGFFYMVAHKHATKYTWNKTASGFLPRNMYRPYCSVMTGIVPPKSKHRLLDFEGQVLRPQEMDMCEAMELISTLPQGVQFWISLQVPVSRLRRACV